jgi:hypothetical protein
MEQKNEQVMTTWGFNMFLTLNDENMNIMFNLTEQCMPKKHQIKEERA